MIVHGEFGVSWLPAVAIAPALLAAGAGALLKGIGGLFGGKAKQKKEQEQAALAEKAARGTWDQKEQTRLALLRSLQSRAGTSGPKVAALLQGLDPAMFEARPYTGMEVGKETGRSTLGDVLSGVGGLASAYGDFESQRDAKATRDAEQLKLLCAIVPSLPECVGQGVPSEAPPGSVGGYIPGTGE